MKYIRSLTFLMILALCGCVELPALDLSSVNVLPQRSFSDSLQQEYELLAEFEREAGREGIADFFEGKAKETTWGKVAKPTHPVERNIPEFSVEELTKAYGMLTGALKTMNIPENEPLLAAAQTRYDCWLVHREHFKQRDAYFACREDYFKMFSLLTIPSQIAKRYEVYFEVNSIEISDEAKDVLKEIARHYRTHNEWTLTLVGHTDSSGNAAHNRVLSLRRGISVKNALAQRGVDPDNIVIAAEGEIESKSGDDSRDEDSRRVDVLFQTRSQGKVYHEITDAPGWTHIGGK